MAKVSWLDELVCHPIPIPHAVVFVLSIFSNLRFLRQEILRAMLTCAQGVYVIDFRGFIALQRVA